MAPSKPPPHVILHVWPLPGGEIPCIEPSCLAAILHLQLAIPNHYAIEYSLPDGSPDGEYGLQALEMLLYALRN